MGDSTKHAALRKRLLKEVYRRSGGNLESQIDCHELAAELKLPIAELMVIAEQLIAKKLLHYLHRPLTADFRGWKIGMTMPGIEEAEKMERNWLKRYYEDHFALYSAAWTFIILVCSVLLNVTTTRLINPPAPPEEKQPIVNNIIMPEQKAPIINIPEQKPPIVNIIVPEQKPLPSPKK